MINYMKISRKEENNKRKFNRKNRKYIISLGCCPNCYGPEPCGCEMEI